MSRKYCCGMTKKEFNDTGKFILLVMGGLCYLIWKLATVGKKKQ